jgi:flagellar M-ring protein FliF
LAVGSVSDERKTGFERRMRDQIEAIVSSVVGPGRARVELTADFDFNRITQTSERFDPEGRVLRSTQTKEESANAVDPAGQVSVANELPGGQPNASAGRDTTKKSEEIANYEISRTTKTEVVEGGRVNRISVAVLVDGSYVKNDKGDVTYQERTSQELDRIAALVRSAIGYDQRRGDQVEVINLRFAETPGLVIPEPTGLLAMFQFTKDDIMHGIELLVMGLLGIIVVLVIVRPLVRRIIEPDKMAAKASETALTGPEAAAGSSETAQAVAATPTGKMLEFAKVQGKVQAEALKQMGELADKNPTETAAIIREWLLEEAIAK